MRGENAVPLRLKCPSCGSELGFLPITPQDSIRCPQCEYSIVWNGDCWDACVDKAYPRDFARQWVLWEAGKLGDPNLIYGHDPQFYFRAVLEHISLTEEKLRSLKILEVGYGHGRLLHQIQQWSPAAYGLDLAKPLRSARLRPGSAIFGNLLNIPFMPRQFDLVICRGVIHVTPDPQKSFGCIAEQVAEQGMLYLGGLYEPGKGNLVLRKIFPWSSYYPEFLRRGMASIFSAGRAVVEALRTRTISLRAFQRFCAHYKLDIFDVLAPRWTSTHAEGEVVGWFRSKGLVAKKVGYGDYVGVRTDALQETSAAKR